eukprot:Tamp_33718.p2 GENE.Tamp_33718~~Tamp_33718.p2  ORF type:complete len:104 (-),score=6.63 Tamp_33718:44-355(-)
MSSRCKKKKKSQSRRRTERKPRTRCPGLSCPRPAADASAEWYQCVPMLVVWVRQGEREGSARTGTPALERFVLSCTKVCALLHKAPGTCRVSHSTQAHASSQL